MKNAKKLKINLEVIMNLYHPNRTYNLPQCTHRGKLITQVIQLTLIMMCNLPNDCGKSWK